MSEFETKLTAYVSEFHTNITESGGSADMDAARAAVLAHVAELERKLTRANDRIADLNEGYPGIAHNLETTKSALAASQERERVLLVLLRIARCPACDGSGGIPVQVGEHEWEQEQCQWCDERQGALAASQERERRVAQIGRWVTPLMSQHCHYVAVDRRNSRHDYRKAQRRRPWSGYYMDKRKHTIDRRKPQENKP